MLAREKFEGLHAWNNGARDWRDRRDTRNHGLGVAPVARGLPVRALETLTVCFIILLESLHLMIALGEVIVPGWIARSLTGCPPVPIMPI
jgi:hypothetical protein